MAVVKNLMVRCGADFSELSKAVKEAQKNISSMKRSASSAGKAMPDLGRQATGAFSSVRKGTASIQRATQSMQTSVSKSSASASSAFASMGKAAVAAGIAMAVKKIVVELKDLTVEALGVESQIENLTRTMGASKSGFMTWAQNTAAAFGISETAAVKYGNAYSNLISGFVSDTATSTAYTKQLIEASAVIASRTGRTVEDVNDRIRSGLLGSTEAIEDLGINVNVALLETTDAFKRLANGRSWEKLTFQEQQQVRLFAIMEQSAKKFGSELAGGGASSLLKFNAELENLKLELGRAFAPLAETVIPALTELVGWLSDGVRWINAFLSALRGETQGSADSLGQAAAGAESTAAGLDSADKAAKSLNKTLSGFDELNVLSPSSETSSTGAGTAWSGPTAQIGDETAPKMNGIEQAVAKAKELLEPLQSINFDNLKQSLDRLRQAIEPFGASLFDGLEWGYTEIFAPMAKWTSEEALPRFLDIVAEAADGLGAVLEGYKTAYKSFYENFLKPVAEYNGQKFLAFCDKFKQKLGQLTSKLKESKAFQDLADILAVIGPRLADMFNFLSDIGSFIGDFTWTEVFVLVEGVLRDIESTLGLIADLLNGDFSGAWDHFRDLMVDNKIENAKSQLSALSEKFGEAKETVGRWVDHWKESIGDFVDTWKTRISGWWDEHVAPWFTAEKWSEVLQGMVDGFADAWNAVYDFFATAVPNWWNENIAPWFTKEKWLELWEDVKVGVKKGWDSVVSFFTVAVPNWWNNNIAPWFTKEKWVELLGNIKNAFADVFEKIKNIVKIPLNAIIGFINTVIGGINKLSFDVPEIKGITKGFHVGFDIPKIPELASGGLAYGPTLAMIGEGRDREAVLPLNQSVYAEIAKGISSSGNPVIATLLEKILSAVEQIDPNISLDGQSLATSSSGYYAAEQRRVGPSVVRVV